MASAGRGAEHEGGIELPAPTHWPLLMAFGVTLGFAGLVTHVAVTAVGLACFVVAAVGWWREVLPAQREERVPLRPVAERARPILPAPAAVAHLELGVAGHRMRLPVEIHPYSAGVKGGLAGGVAMALVATLYGYVTHGSLWYSVNLLAAGALPSLAQASEAEIESFRQAGLVVGALVHLLMSVLVGLLYGMILPMFARHPAIWGGILAPLLWTGLAWASLGIVNPALNARIDWPWFAASQLAFGLVAGFVVHRSERIATMQSWPLAVRAGLETQDEETRG